MELPRDEGDRESDEDGMVPLLFWGVVVGVIGLLFFGGKTVDWGLVGLVAVALAPAVLLCVGQEVANAQHRRERAARIKEFPFLKPKRVFEWGVGWRDETEGEVEDRLRKEGVEQ